MKRTFTTAAWFAAALSAAILQPSIVGSASAHDAETVKQIFSQKLPNVPGNSMTAFVVDYAPGGKGQTHHHSGSVFAYVLEGEIRSQISDGQPEPGTGFTSASSPRGRIVASNCRQHQSV